MASTIYDLSGAYADSTQTSFIGAVDNKFEKLRQWASAPQGHHIIPQSFLTGSTVDLDVQTMLRALTEKGLFSVRDSIQNCISLPTNQADANATMMALHNPGDSHPAYRGYLNTLLRQIYTEYFAPGSSVIDAPVDKLKAAAADIAGLQNYVAERLSMGVDPETGKPTSTDIKLSSGDTRTGQDNRSLTLDIRKIRETQSFMRGQSAFSAALNAADSAAARAVLIAARVAQDTAIARFIGQIKAGQTIVGDDGESGGKSSGNKNLYGLLTKFGKVLGWIGLGESAANVIISAYKGGATGFWNALYEEGQGFAVGAAIGVAAIGITWAIPVAAPVIAGIGVVLTAVGVVSMGIHIYEMLTAVDSGKAPNPVSDSVLGVQQDRAPDFLAMMAESTPVEGKTILAFGSRETTGTNGNDLIFAANVNDVDAGEGNDIVFYYGADSKSGTARGGSGNDWVIAAGGQNATTVGGTGRDWIYNRSNGGIIYGDTIDGIDPVTGRKVEDSAANADNIWYSANTKVMDAQHHDVLKFYGLTLTGGNAEGGVAGLLAFGGIGAVTGLANFYSSLDANGKYDPARSV